MSMLGQTTAPTRTPTSPMQATHALVRQHDRGGSERTTLRDGDPATAEAPARPLPSPSPALGAHGLALIPPSHPSSRRPPGRSVIAFRSIERIRNGEGDPKQSGHQFTRSSTRRVPRWPKPKPGTPLHASRSRWVDPRGAACRRPDVPLRRVTPSERSTPSRRRGHLHARERAGVRARARDAE